MDLTTLEVKEHPFYKGLLVRSDGYVKGIKGDFKKGTLTNHGYLMIRLDLNGKRNNLLVHRLVAETFLGNPLNLPTVDHIDRNRSNNSVENLRWASYRTQADNSANCDNIISPVRECENKIEYDRWHNKSCLGYITPEGKETRTGFLYQTEFERLKNLSYKERYIEYQRIKDERRSNKSRRLFQGL